MSTGPFDPLNQLGDIFGKGPSGYGTQFGKEEKGVPWDAKEIGGDLYVPLEQVGELLKENGVLPKMQERIAGNVQAAKDRKTLDI